MRTSRAVLTALSLLVFALVLLPESARDRALAAVLGRHPLDFTLRAATGSLDTKSLRGSVVLLYFGYTSCPDACPTTLSAIASALGSLGSLADGVQVVFVSVDPARDTPARLAEYAAYFHPRIVGVTGTDAELAAATGRFRASFSREPADEHGDYAVIHSGRVFVRDPQGDWVMTFEPGCSSATMATRLRGLLVPRHDSEEHAHATSG